jgi:hypothetical protein
MHTIPAEAQLLSHPDAPSYTLSHAVVAEQTQRSSGYHLVNSRRSRILQLSLQPVAKPLNRGSPARIALSRAAAVLWVRVSWIENVSLQVNLTSKDEAPLVFCQVCERIKGVRLRIVNHLSSSEDHISKLSATC